MTTSNVTRIPSSIDKLLIFHRLLGSDDENATFEERAERLLFYSSKSSSSTSESMDIPKNSRERGEGGRTSADAVVRSPTMCSKDNGRIECSKSESSTEDDEEKEVYDAEYNHRKETTEKYIKRVLKEAGLSNVINVRNEVKKECSYGEKELSLLHMLESLLHFSKKFCRHKVEIILTEKLLWCFYECEENVTMCAAVKMVEKNGRKKSEINRDEIILMLKKFYCVFVAQHGTFESILYNTKKKLKVTFSENDCNNVNENILVNINDTNSTDDDENQSNNQNNGNSSISNIVQRIPFQDFDDAKISQIDSGIDLIKSHNNIVRKVEDTLDANNEMNNLQDCLTKVLHDNIQGDVKDKFQLNVDNNVSSNIDDNDDKNIDNINNNNNSDNKDIKNIIEDNSNYNIITNSTYKHLNILHKDLNNCTNSNKFSPTLISSKPDSQAILQLKRKISLFFKKDDNHITQFSRISISDDVDNEYIENYMEMKNNDVLNNSQEIPNLFLTFDEKESFVNDVSQANNIRTNKIFTLMQKKEIPKDFQLSKIKKNRNFTLQKIFQYFK